MKCELAEVLRPKTWLRIFAGTILATLLLAWIARRAFPDLEFNWTVSLARATGILLLGMGLFIGVLLLIPPRININGKGISRQQGQSVRWWLRGDLRRLTLDLTDAAQPKLRIETAGGAFEAGIAAKIEPARLVAFLRATFPDLLVDDRG